MISKLVARIFSRRESDAVAEDLLERQRLERIENYDRKRAKLIENETPAERFERLQRGL